MCFREERNSGLGRPEKFEADGDNGVGMIVLEKVTGKEKDGADPGKSENKNEFAQADWNKLKGTWVTPFQRSPDGNGERRLGLELRDVRNNLLFYPYEEVKTADGRTEKQPVHSAVLVVVAFQEADGRRFLVVTPSRPPRRPEFDQQIRYEFHDGQLRLEGRLGTRDLTGAWSRVVENR